jgi:hypothetical protein
MEAREYIRGGSRCVSIIGDFFEYLPKGFEVEGTLSAPGDWKNDFI